MVPSVVEVAEDEQGIDPTASTAEQRFKRFGFLQVLLCRVEVLLS